MGQLMVCCIERRVVMIDQLHLNLCLFECENDLMDGFEIILQLVEKYVGFITVGVEQKTVNQGYKWRSIVGWRSIVEWRTL